MADALKTFFDAALVRRLADGVARVHPAFPKARFVRAASDGLDALELLERARHIAAALADALPSDYPKAIGVLLRSLGPEHATDELLGVGMAPFFYLPHVIFVAERGLDHFDLSMNAQVELTKRFSAEFSVRAYIAKDPERAFRFFGRWIADPNPHVRRLVSEGTRSRLPWAPRVAWLDAHPERVLALLDRLKDDPAPLVRRSVANNLNDLGKARPDLLERTCAAWLQGASAERRALVEHALRSAVKRGDRAALKLLGFGGKARVAIEGVAFTPRRVPIGGKVVVVCSTRNTSKTKLDALVDLVVHFVKAGGKTGAKTFKGRRVSIGGGDAAEFRFVVSLAVHTTRKPRVGRHDVELLVNGESFSIGGFDVIETSRRS